MTISEWFQDDLQASLEGFIWAVEQVPAGRRNLRPPFLLGDWSAARHAFHLLHYERTYALPGMRQWLGGPPPGAVGLSEEAAWADGPLGGPTPDLDGILAALREVRGAQIALLPELDEVLWEAEHATVWGRKALRWVVTKTYQHTAEHTHDVLSLALFWDMAG